MVGAARGRQGERLEQLPNGAVGEIPLERAAVGGQYVPAAVSGEVARRPQQGGLTDARRSFHDDQAASGLLRLGEQALQPSELSLAFQEQDPGCRGRRTGVDRVRHEPILAACGLVGPTKTSGVPGRNLGVTTPMTIGALARTLGMGTLNRSAVTGEDPIRIT